MPSRRELAHVALHCRAVALDHVGDIQSTALALETLALNASVSLDTLADWLEMNHTRVVDVDFSARMGDWLSRIGLDRDSNIPLAIHVVLEREEPREEP